MQHTLIKVLGLALASLAANAAAAQTSLFDAGRTSFKAKCALCHTVVQGEPNGAGPNLHGVLGRSVASAPGFGYSGALTRLGGFWDKDRLLAYLASPAAYAPGNVMPFAGLKSQRERHAVVCFLGGDPKAEVCQ